MARCLEHPEAPQIESRRWARQTCTRAPDKRTFYACAAPRPVAQWSCSKAGPLAFITRPNAVTGLGPRGTYSDPKQLGPLHRLSGWTRPGRSDRRRLALRGDAVL